MAHHDRLLKTAQWTLITAGVVLLGLWAGTRLSGVTGKNEELRRFEDARSRQRTAPTEQPTVETLPTELPVDTTLWAPDRVKEYEESLDHDLDLPLAVLRIPTIHLEVPVLSGTSELVLNRGVGHITGTPLPGDEGNIGIAGHRDGYFRSLKDVGEGDVIEIETLAGTSSYVITELFIVDPEEVWVLDPTPKPTVTLVTCYPFYFVGSAPQRYIVRAERVDS